MLHITRIEPGRTYRLRRNWEVRDERTGTIRDHLLKGTPLNVRAVEPDNDRVWVAGLAIPLPLSALSRAVDPADDALGA